MTTSPVHAVHQLSHRELVSDGPAGNTIYEGDPTRLPADPARLRRAMLEWMRDHDAMPAHPDVWLFREGAKLLNADSRARHAAEGEV